MIIIIDGVGDLLVMFRMFGRNTQPLPLEAGITVVQTDPTTHSDLREYAPTSLTHISRIRPDGNVDLAIRIYLPQRSSSEDVSQPSSDKSSGTQGVQVKIGRRFWQKLNPPTSTSPYWTLDLEQLDPGTPLRFRFCNQAGQWHPIAPLTDLERVEGVYYIPKLNYVWNHDRPKPNHARVLMETTLEGLLAGYEGGVFAPRSRAELFRDPITRHILRTDIPNQLAELGIDQIMITTSSAVSDRSSLNPRFNYLTYDVADIDWQLGHACDLISLLDILHGEGITLVPDLAFAHQVRTPFEGSLDQIKLSEDGDPLFVDTDAFMWRNYGTWMFKLEDPEIRKQLVEKIVSFAVRYRLSLIRLGYLDGLIQQYSQRPINYGEIFLAELKAELQQVSPETRILGETFIAKDDPKIKECVDLFYAPYGFPLVEEIYKPPSRRAQPLIPDFDHLIAALRQAVECQRHNAVYAQLHDETCQDDHVAAERPEAHWAYGGNPAELTRVQGEDLIQRGLLPQEDLLDYARRIVRSAETLTMFAANLMYMFVPGVDSLIVGCLEAPGNWRFHWDNVTAEQLEFWQKTGLSDRQIYLLHKQHRLDMARLRQIFRDYTFVDPDTLDPLTKIQIHHTDPDHAVVALWRFNPNRLSESILVIFNLGPTAFKQHKTSDYKLPAPLELDASWEVLFDGDWIDPLLRTSDRRYYLDQNEDMVAYSPGTILQPDQSPNSDASKLIRFNLGAFSLLVLKVNP